MVEHKEYIARLQSQFQEQLTETAITYLDTGLTRYFGWDPEDPNPRIYRNDTNHPQGAIGNLSISIELMLKACVASKHLLLLFRSLPLQVRAFLLCPDSLPTEFNRREFDSELKFASYDLIDFTESISLFLLFVPAEKPILQSHLQAIPKYRNASVHSILPVQQAYEVDRTAWVAMRVYEVLQRAGVLGSTQRLKFYGDQDFVRNFNKEKLEQTRKKIEKAREQSHRLPGTHVQLHREPNDWEHLVIKCPICDNDCIVGGDSTYGESPMDSSKTLVFKIYQLECKQCGLQLDDVDELYLAGIARLIDISDRLPEYLSNDIPDSSVKRVSP